MEKNERFIDEINSDLSIYIEGLKSYTRDYEEMKSSFFIGFKKHKQRKYLAMLLPELKKLENEMRVLLDQRIEEIKQKALKENE